MRAGKRAATPPLVLVLERMFNTLVKLGVAAYLLAWVLSFTSSRPLWNLPLAVAAVVAFRWMSRYVVVQPRGRGTPIDPGAAMRKAPRRYSAVPPRYSQRPPTGSDSGPHRDAWRRGVNAPIVESAWDSLCGSIIQEFVYDAWYSSLTPDREFPAEIRRLLNEGFADVAQRARKIDLRTVLIGDMSALVIEHLELYRSTREGVGLLSDHHLTPAARDRAFQQEMRTEGTLHPAFCTRDGHYRVIRGIADCIVSCSLSKPDLARPYVQALAREIIATCVLRPIIMYFTRYNAARLILSLWPEELEQIQAKIAKRLEEMVGKEELIDGHFEFEQRARKAAVLEMKAEKKARHRRSTVPPHQQRESSSAEDSYSDIQPPSWRYRSLEDLKESVDSQAAEEFSNKDDNASEASSIFTEQRSVMSEPLSARSTPKAASLRGSETMSPSLAGVDSPPTASNGHIFDAQVSMTSLPAANGKLSNDQPFGSVCWVRARVVAPEIIVERSREFVVFKIRVADGQGEWTVARRYRNFESLHKMLRDIPEYRSLPVKLPPKRFLVPSKTTEFVEERRVALDKYLQAILSSPALAMHPEVFKFLCNHHKGIYQPSIDVSLLKTVANNADSVKHRVKTAVGDAIGEGKARLMGRSRLSSAQADIPGFPRTRVSPHLSENVFGQWSTGHVHQDQLRAQMRQQDPRAPQGWRQNAPPSPRALSDSGAPLHSRDAVSSPIRAPSPLHQQPPLVPRLHFGHSREGLHDSQSWEPKAQSMPTEVKSVDGSTSEPLIRFQAGHDPYTIGSSMQVNKQGQGASSLRLLPSVDDDDMATDWDAEFEDCAGVSAPLYRVVECVFDMPAQKFFRRQVFQAVRQLLSLLAGDVIDVYLVERLKSIRTEHCIARWIHFMKSALWPGGKWFASLGPYAAARDAQNAGKRPQGVQKDKYLEPLMEPPDEEEMAERLRHRLIIQAPPAFTRLVGRGTYLRGMRDIHDMLQLPTFLTQIGYGVLEIAVLALYPELKDFFGRIHRDAGMSS